jgi:hypothetical protein
MFLAGKLRPSMDWESSRHLYISGDGLIASGGSKDHVRFVNFPHFNILG